MLADDVCPATVTLAKGSVLVALVPEGEVVVSWYPISGGVDEGVCQLRVAVLELLALIDRFAIGAGGVCAKPGVLDTEKVTADAIEVPLTAATIEPVDPEP
jgi:hypothetical protein